MTFKEAKEKLINNKNIIDGENILGLYIAPNGQENHIEFMENCFNHPNVSPSRFKDAILSGFFENFNEIQDLNVYLFHKNSMAVFYGSATYDCTVDQFIQGGESVEHLKRLWKSL